MKGFRLICLSLLSLVAAQNLVSCASDEPKRRERVAPAVTDSTLPWNRPRRGEGTGPYGSMMPQSR